MDFNTYLVSLSHTPLTEAAMALYEASEGDARKYMKKVLISLGLEQELADDYGENWSELIFKKLRKEFIRLGCDMYFLPGLARILYGELDFDSDDEASCRLSPVEYYLVLLVAVMVELVSGSDEYYAGVSVFQTASFRVRSFIDRECEQVVAEILSARFSGSRIRKLAYHVSVLEPFLPDVPCVVRVMHEPAVHYGMVEVKYLLVAFLELF